MIFTFADCELDEELFELRRRGRPVKLEPRAFDVLRYLLRRRERVVSKDELLDALWPRVAVSESVLPGCIAAVRRAVGGGRASRSIVQTVHGRGYRVACDVRERAPGETAGDPARDDGVEPGGAVPFVGRERALARLRGALGSACAGRGRLVLLSGEPGIGKTRIALELVLEARRRDARAVVGRSFEDDGAPAFWPWVQVLRACARAGDAAELADELGPAAAQIAELVPELRERLPDLAESARLGADQLRFRLFDAVARFVRRVSARRPLVIVLEDLQRADEGSLGLVRFLAPELREARVLLVGTYRDVEVRRGHPLGDFLAALAVEPACDPIPLRGLERGETADLMERVAGEPPGLRLAETVHEMTEGNPFFVQEITRLLAARGSLAAPQPTARAALALPQSVRDAIGRRLDALSPRCNALLRQASVLGREFGAAALARFADLPLETVVEALAEAVEARVVAARPETLDRYAFHHALFRQTLYEELRAPERMRLHLRAGELLEAACAGSPEPVLGELAHHFAQAAPAGDVERAATWCERAAERAHRLCAYEESARLYGRALEVLELTPGPADVRRARLLLAHGDALATAGAREPAHEAFLRAAEIARRDRRPDLLARAALGLRGVVERGTPADPTTRALIEESLEALDDEHPGLRARLLDRLSGMPPFAHSMERREALAREAHALARASGDPEALVDALSARLWAHLGPDHVEERAQVGRELLGLAERTGDRALALVGHDALQSYHLVRGEIEAADRALAAFGRIAEELRHPASLFHATVCRGSRLLARGSFAAAERAFAEAHERSRGLIPYGHFVYAGQMFLLGAARGQEVPVDVQDTLREMIELPYSWELALRSGLALRSALVGEHARARSELDAIAEAGLERVERDEHWLLTMNALATLVIEVEDGTRAETLLELLGPYADLVFVHDLLRSIGGSVASALSQLATLLGRFDEAESHYGRALAREEAMGARPHLLGTRAGGAWLFARRGRRGDRARADALLREVEREARALGVRLEATYVAGLRARAGAAPGPRRKT